MYKNGYIYLIEQSKYLKIGFTTDLTIRKKQYDTHNANYKLLYCIKGNNLLEQELHKKWNKYKYKTEWFFYHEDIINYFKYFDLFTNEIKPIYLTEYKLLDVKDLFYKIDSINLYGLKPDFCIKVFLFILENSKNNEIYITKNIREQIQTECDISKSSVTLALNLLIQNNLIKRNERSKYIIVK